MAPVTKRGCDGLGKEAGYVASQPQAASSTSLEGFQDGRGSTGCNSPGGPGIPALPEKGKFPPAMEEWGSCEERASGAAAKRLVTIFVSKNTAAENQLITASGVIHNLAFPC